MRRPKSIRAAEDFGRIRLSKSFFMRDFLYSEIANIHGLTNLPEDPDLAVQAGSKLCSELLEPLQDTFGRLGIRSGYRAPAVNGLGNERYGNCASNKANQARHIWDQRSENGGMGAMATVVVPWLADRKDGGTSWTSMAWWISRQPPVQRTPVFPEAIRVQHRLARIPEEAHRQLRGAARASHEARKGQSRRRPFGGVSGLPTTYAEGASSISRTRESEPSLNR